MANELVFRPEDASVDSQTLQWVELATAWWMFGAAWFVQQVHYPAFRFIPRERFVEFHRFHVSGIGPVVAPPMLVGLAASSARALQLVEPIVLAGWACCAFGFAWTFAVSVPEHNKLVDGWNESAMEALIRRNMPRTLAWSGHAVLVTMSLWL